MTASFTEEAWEDYEYWINTDKKMVRKINTILKDIKQSPFSGIGKPEPLRYELQGFWSRRINLEHRLVYKIENDDILILSCRFHY